MPIDEIEDTASRLQHARVVRFPNAGHGMAGEQATVIALVREFVEGA